MRSRAPSGGSTSMMSSATNNINNSSSPPKRKERQTNFKVVVRVRPPLPRELSGDIPFQNIVAVDRREQQIIVSENLDAVLDDNGDLLANTGPYSTFCFNFDYVYDEHANQKKIYENTARTVVDSALQGYNATIFAYGQTGTGKTYTMEGFTGDNSSSLEARGIIPRAIEQIFGHIHRNASPRMRFLVRASYLQIYNEQISDLLKPERTNLAIREDKKRGVFVEGLSEWVVRSPAEIYGLMQRGGIIRATGETKMNETSSRSHAVFIVIAEQSETVYVDDHGNEMSADDFNKFLHQRGVRREGDMKRLEDHLRQSFKVGKLNLVDLAGSERVALSGASGQRLEESKQINRSLSALGNVISALTELKGRQHIPYRDSKLTRMLEDSLGGNCKTTMMAMISPALEAMVETISTLKFANRAKNIKNEAKVNEDLDQKSLLRKYERELKNLRAELEERSKNVVDKRRLLELDEHRRRAEADKMAAIRALEAKSLEFMKEKEEKKRLEQRINMLMGQMIRGEKGAYDDGSTQSGLASMSPPPHGQGPDAGSPSLHMIMKVQQDQLRQEYEGKLAELERERESVVEEKAQVDRYKQLLLKQRDIMIALTQRLVERDEQIVALQDELDAYDQHHKELEEKLDEKTAMLIRFQRISMEVNAKSPFKNEELGRAMEAWAESQKTGQKDAAIELPSDFDEENGDGPYNPSNQELSNVVQSQRAQIQKLTAELQTQKGKSPNNQEARSRIEASFRSAVDEVSYSIRDGGAQEAVRSMLMRLKQNVNMEVERSVGKTSPLDGGTDSGTMTKLQMDSLQNQCSALVREREALHTILERKIKVLVQSVSQALDVIIREPTRNSMSGGPIQALAKDVAALQHLVNASVSAMKNSGVSLSSHGEPMPNQDPTKIGHVQSRPSPRLAESSTTPLSVSRNQSTPGDFFRTPATQSMDARGMSAYDGRQSSSGVVGPTGSHSGLRGTINPPGSYVSNGYSSRQVPDSSAKYVNDGVGHGNYQRLTEVQSAQASQTRRSVPVLNGTVDGGGYGR